MGDNYKYDVTINMGVPTIRLQLYEHIMTLLKECENSRKDSILSERFGTSSFEDLLHVTYDQYMRKRLFYGDQQHVEWLFSHGYYEDARDFFIKKLYQWHEEDPLTGVNMRIAADLQRGYHY